jgi:hypothetical protein
VDQLVLDELPDDPGHLVAVHLDDGILHLDLRHMREATFLRARKTPGAAAARVYTHRVSVNTGVNDVG